MAYKFNYITLTLTLCMLLTACRDNDDVLVDPSTGSGSDFGKTPIELSVGGVNGDVGCTGSGAVGALVGTNSGTIFACHHTGLVRALVLLLVL